MPELRALCAASDSYTRRSNSSGHHRIECETRGVYAEPVGGFLRTETVADEREDERLRDALYRKSSFRVACCERVAVSVGYADPKPVGIGLR